MAKGLGTLTAWLHADTRDFTKNMTSAKKTMQTFSRAATVGITAAGAGIVAFGVSAVRAFMPAQEAVNKFGEVFSGVRSQAELTARKLSDSFNLATSSAKEMLANTGDLLVGFGFTDKAALEMSDKINRLSIDLSSFTNYQGGAVGAASALTRGLVGEREAMKALGILVTEDLVQAELIAKGKSKLTGMSLLQAKAEATLTIAMRQSKKAIGDYARTSDSLVNVNRSIGESYKSIKESIGEVISEGLGLRKTMGSIAAGMRGVSKSLEGSIQGLSFLAQAMYIEIETALSQTWTLAMNIGTGLADIFGTAGQNILNVFTWVSENLFEIVTNIPNLFIGVMEDIVNLVMNVGKTLLEYFQNLGTFIWEALFGDSSSDVLDNMFSNLTDGIAKGIADIGKSTAAAMNKAKISELEIAEPDYAKGFGRILDDIDRIDKEKAKRLDDLFKSRLEAAGALDEGAAEGAAKADDSKKQKFVSPVTAAVQKGSLEAFKLEQGRAKVDDKIEANTRKSANGIDKMVAGIDRLAASIKTTTGMQLEEAI